MGIYLNPGNDTFSIISHSKMYIDKTGVVNFTNNYIGEIRPYIASSRPRRFGKTIAAETLAGNRCKINTNRFQNDMTTFMDADDVLTLLMHLGYLAYDSEKEEAYIPNSEVRSEMVNAVSGDGWDEVYRVKVG